MAAALLVALNLADAWLTGAYAAIGELDLNPLVPPFMANVAARGLLAVVLILALYLMKKQGLLWWLNLAVMGLIGLHSVGQWVTTFNGSPS